MILHIKPTAKKDQVFRFKSNFIRFFTNLSDPKITPLVLLEGIRSEGDGISETASNITGAISQITAKYTAECQKEIKMMLELAARELSIPLE